jgi:hypothetical protein
MSGIRGADGGSEGSTVVHIVPGTAIEPATHETPDLTDQAVCRGRLCIAPRGNLMVIFVVSWLAPSESDLTVTLQWVT